MMLIGLFMLGASAAFLIAAGLVWLYDGASDNKDLSAGEERYRCAVIDRCVAADIQWKDENPAETLEALCSEDTLIYLADKKFRAEFRARPVAEGFRRWICVECDCPLGDLPETVKCVMNELCAACGEMTIRPERSFVDDSPCACRLCLPRLITVTNGTFLRQ